MSPRIRLLACTGLVCAALGLAGCAAAPPDDDPLFPLAEGRRWTYRVSTEVDERAAVRETLVLHNRGADRIDGAPSWRRRSDAGIEYWHRSDATGIYRIAARHPLQREPQVDPERRYVLRKPYVVGTEWEASTVAYVLARRNEVPREVRHTHKPSRMLYRIEAIDQTVQTAAGSFDGCLRVGGRADVRLYVDAAFQWRDIPLITLEWYCPGVGLVRLERKEATPTRFMVGGTVTLDLTAWH